MYSMVMGEATDMERGKMDIIKDNYKKNRFKIPRVSRYDIRRALKIATIASLGVLTLPKDKDVVFVESEQIETTSRMRNIDFQVDTVAVDYAYGYFNVSKNSITINYLENDEEFNKWSKSKAVIIHEQKHRDNYNQGMYAYALSVEQAYKIDMHDEISANMASLIYLRDEYLRTGDISVFDECGMRFSFYTDAIKNGEINPFSNSKEDFDKDMSLIANGTRDMWVKYYRRTAYVELNSNSALCYGEKNGTHAEFYDQNYERAKKIAYTIGGVDFTKYMDKDVEIPEEGKKRILPVSQLVKYIWAAGFKCVEVGKGCAYAIKGWLGMKDDENKPVRPVKEDNTPQYEEWSKEKRVSPVQNAQILNLMADVIEKPSDRPDRFLGRKPKEDREALKKDMQNEAKEKARMIKVVEGMNRVNGAKKAIDVSQTINTLYDKFGDNAYELLTKAVNEPFNFAQNIGDSSIRTSRDAVRSLCDTDETKRDAVISAVLKERGR